MLQKNWRQACSRQMIGFGLVMAVVSIVMGGVNDSWRADDRAAMDRIESGQVPAIAVHVAGVYANGHQDTWGTTRGASSSTQRIVKWIRFKTDDGRFFEKGWVRDIETRKKQDYKGYIVNGKLYVPDLYDETRSFLLYFIGGGFLFLFVCVLVSRFFCSRIGRSQTEHS